VVRGGCKAQITDAMFPLVLWLCCDCCLSPLLGCVSLLGFFWAQDFMKTSLSSERTFFKVCYEVEMTLSLEGLPAKRTARHLFCARKLTLDFCFSLLLIPPAGLPLFLPPGTLRFQFARSPPQWVWAGLNLGALGTFALVFFRDEGFPYRLIVVGVAWTMALTSALYGLRQFHRRRRALLSVVDDPETWESPHAPALVVAAFVTMMLTLIVYAIASGQQFGFQDKASDASAAPDQ